jgi:hypothetical protein
MIPEYFSKVTKVPVMLDNKNKEFNEKRKRDVSPLP